jgi:hypothetical protein
VGSIRAGTVGGASSAMKGKVQSNRLSLQK